MGEIVRVAADRLEPAPPMPAHRAYPTPPPEPAHPLPAGAPAWVGPYRVLGYLGEGGMGRVYKAAAPYGRLVAVKVVRPEYAAVPEFRARFQREVASAARVPRFCTAEVLGGAADATPDGELLYLVTEFIDGPSLKESVARDGPWLPGALEQLGVSMASALAAIHGAGIIHRDLKPGNVLLSRSGPRVIDFGIARALDTTSVLTGTGHLVGTPGFVAPEQYLGEAPSPAVDVFAWGGVLAYAATGRYPFGGGEPHMIAYRVVHDRPDLDGLTGNLRAVVEAAMAKEPPARPTPEELQAHLTSRSPWETPQASPRAGPRPSTHGSAAPPSSAPGSLTSGSASARATPARSPASGSGSAVAATGVPVTPVASGVASGPGVASPRQAAPPRGSGPTAGRRLGRAAALLTLVTALLLGAVADSPPETVRAAPDRQAPSTTTASAAAAPATSTTTPPTTAPATTTAPPTTTTVPVTEGPQVFTVGIPGTLGAGLGGGAGVIGRPGETDIYRFTGTQGARVFLAALACRATPAAATLTLTLTGPAGPVRVDRPQFCKSGEPVDPGPVTLPATGAYQLAVTAVGGATGTYGLHLRAVTYQQFRLTFGQTVAPGVPPGAGHIEAAGDMDWYQFPGQPGQHITLRADSCQLGDGVLRYVLWRPGSTDLTGVVAVGELCPRGGNGGQAVATLPVAGMYQITVDAGGYSDTGTYRLTLTSP